MFWIAPAVGAAMGLLTSYQQQKADKQARQNQALLNMYAPLFGQEVKSVEPVRNHILPGIMSGAIRGYEFGSQLEMADLLKEAAKEQLVSPTAQGQTYGLNLPPMRSVFDTGETSLAGYSPSLSPAGSYNLDLGMRSMFNENPWKTRLSH